MAAATLALASASPALAAGRLSSTGNCGDLLDMWVKNVGDDIDSPPNLAILELTFDGAALACGQSVTVRYSRPLTSGQATCATWRTTKTPSFGPVTVPVL